MDTLLSVLRLLVCLGCCAGLPGLAFAFGTVDQGSEPATRYMICSGTGSVSGGGSPWPGSVPACTGSPPSGGLPGGPFVTANSACDAYAAYHTAQSGWVFGVSSYPGSGAGTCVLTRTSPPGGSGSLSGSVTQYTYNVATCPASSALVGSSCVCNQGFAPNSGGTACQAVNCAALPVNPLFGYMVTADATPGLVQCIGGCQVRGSLWAKSADHANGILWEPQATGATCEGTIAPTPTAAQRDGETVEPWPEPLAKGKCPGEVNGEPVIVDCSEAQTGNSVKTTKPDGATETTTKGTTCQGNACTTTTQVVSCSASAVCSTTTTISQGVDTQDKNSIGGLAGGGSSGGGGGCADNPSAAGCGGTPGTIGDGYAEKGKTIGSVLGGFSTALQGTPLGQGVGGFFNVDISVSTCPTWDLDLDFFSTTYTLDFMCMPALQTIFAVIHAVLMLVASWSAFRIAVF